MYLLFPSDDALRQALAAGLIPPAVAARPVAAAFDAAGRVCVDAPAELVRATLPSLRQFGVRAVPGDGPPPQLYPCWHELVALRPGSDRPAAEFRIRPPASPPADPPSPLPPVPVALSLRRRREAAREEAWVLAGDAGAALVDFLRDADEQTLRRLRAAVVGDGAGGRRVVLRPAKGGTAAPPPAGDGYAAHPGVPGLLVPATHVLSPQVRRDRLAAAVGLTDRGLVWLERTDGGTRPHRAEDVRFHPAAELVEYRAPPLTRLAAAWGTDSPFAPEPVGPITDTEPPVPTPPARTGTHSRPAPRPGAGWLTRSLHRFARKLRRGPHVARPNGAPVSRTPAGVELGPTDDPPPDRTARRAELEDRLVRRLAGLAGTDRAALWAEAAELAAEAGQDADAGLCWANAVWEADAPPMAWFEAWLRAELRAAKITHGPEDLGELLARTDRRPPPRLAAAYLAWCGARPEAPDPPARLVAVLDERADRVPVRAAWLARVAAARLSGGDPLGLARWRDATFRRLAEAGPALDLDAPSFVRFHGRPGGDRFRDARAWLLRMRDPAHHWLARQASPRRLHWFGLDPETGATAGYLDLLFAWGAARLGERAAARAWEEAAAAILARPAAENGVHAVLLAAFRRRIREARQGRAERPGLPPDALQAYSGLTDHQRYAVDALRRASGVLEPADRVNPYRGKDAAEFLGADPLGLRLRRLGDLPPGDDLDREVRALLALADRDPAPGTLPRVALAAVAVAPRLPADTALDVLGRVPAAVRLTPEWVWAARGGATGPRQGLEKSLGAFLNAAAVAAAVFDAPDVLRDLCRYLAGPAAPPAPIPAAAVGPVAGRFFRALRRLGLTAEAAAVLDRLAPAGPVGADDPAGRVGFAVGWLAVGNEDAAARLLDEARDRLFADAAGTAKQRSRLAVAYAAALGHARPGTALGRLEEIVLRLDGATAPGSANRFFTVSFLELADAIVRAVVSDDFALGPEVRGWLDDHEFGTRRRISRDLDAVLAAAGLAAK